MRDSPPHEGVRGLGFRPLRAASHDQDHLRNAAVLQDVFLGHGKDNYGVLCGATDSLPDREGRTRALPCKDSRQAAGLGQ